MESWSENEKIVWKASIQHYPFWFLSSTAFEDLNINNVWLPLLRQYEFDFIFVGHEHMISYAYLKNNVPLSQTVHQQLMEARSLQTYNCTNGEFFFNDTTKEQRKSEWKQGDALHQITIGNTGAGLGSNYDNICPDKPQQATFRYA